MVTSLPSLVIHRTVDQHSVLDELPRWALYILALGCLSLAAIVAGLTLGLMSLDMVSNYVAIGERRVGDAFSEYFCTKNGYK